MGIFGNIQQASVSQSGPKLPDNFSGILEIVQCSILNGHTGTRYIAEFVVHETNNPNEAPVGYRPSWAPDLKQPNTPGNILCFVASAFGIDPQTQEAQMRASVTEAHVDATVDSRQLIRGRFLHCDTQEITTQKTKNLFMVHRWGPTPKTFASRINDASVAPTGAPMGHAPMGGAPSIPNAPGGFMPQMQAQAPTAPGGFGSPTAPGGFMPSMGIPTAPMPQAAPPMQAPQMGGFMPQMQPQIPTQMQPQIPGMPQMGMQAQQPSFPQPTIPSLPSLPGMPGLPPGGMPGLPPGLPPLPQAAPQTPAFPPSGWVAHPGAAGYYWCPAAPHLGAKTEADLRAGR